MSGAAQPDFFGMSDDDFLQLNNPDPTPSVAEDPKPEPVVEPAAPVAEIPSSGSPEEVKPVETPEEPAGVGSKKEDDPSDEEVLATEPPKAEETPKSETKQEPAPEGAAPAAASAAPETAEKPAEAKEGEKPAEAPAETQVNYEDFYKQIMTPFKANGKTIELKTPEEAIRLMQMGAGYGRKIQDLQPHLKMIRMLEKNDLLDADRISYLIDINNKNPDAIKKLIKESGIDPLDINTEDNVNYRPTNHSVSDQEMAFNSALSDLNSHPSGQETIKTINQTWDEESKAALWDQPDIFGVIQTQREAGIYDQIASEIDRQKLLGKIPPNTPFLQAYKLAGDHLQATNGFKLPEGQTPPNQTQTVETPAPQPAPQPQPQVLATRPEQPKSTVKNDDKANAATPTRTAPRQANAPLVNPLSMADEDFLKTFEHRL